MGRRTSLANLALAAIVAPFLASAAPTMVEKREPLLGFAGTELAALKPSPTAFQPDLPKRSAEEDLVTDADMFEFKRRSSMKFRERAEAHVNNLNRRMRQKRDLGERDFTVPMQEVEPEIAKRAGIPKALCLAAGANQDDMTNAFLAGGQGYRLALCPGVTYNLNDTIYFTSNTQELYTFGYPQGNTRATLLVTGSAQSVALYGGCDDCAKVAIRNVQINGNRPGLGRLDDGSALIEMGGSGGGQIVSSSHLYEPRGWSAFHMAEGYQLSCSGATILNNQIGPSGNSPNSAYQFHRVMAEYAKIRNTPSMRKRDSTVQAPGQWADGVSVACANSVIRGNTVTDATDGAIVLFGSPGTQVTGNTIISDTRVGLGGINMVDKWPWGGSFDGVIVSKNNLITKNSMIKVGIAMGPMVWGTYNESDGRTWGGNVKQNSFSSVNGYFGFAIAVGGHFSSTVTGNVFNGARFNYAPSYACFPQWMPPPAGPVVRDPTTTNGTFQSETVLGPIVIAICIMPCEYSDAGCTWNASKVVATSSSAIAASSTTVSSQAAASSTSVVAAQNAAKVQSTTTTAATSTTKVKVNKNAKTTAATSSKAAKHPKREEEDDVFVDDRPPYTFDSNKGLTKADGDYILPDAPFHAAIMKRDDINNSDVLLLGYGRNVYEKDALAEGFLAPLES